MRELVQIVQAAALLPPDAESLQAVLPPAAERESAGPSSPFWEAKRAAIAAFERQYFTVLHEAAQSNVSEMARRAGMERHHVKGYLKKLGLRGAGKVADRPPRRPAAHPHCRRRALIAARPHCGAPSLRRLLQVHPARASGIS